MMVFLTLIFGAFVGYALGLTGGGGSLLAVPLLVYGLGESPRTAIGVSLATVAVMAASGLWGKYRRGEVEVKTGLIFAVAGMLSAPLGTWVSGNLSETVLLTSFSMLMMLIAVRMWLVAGAAKKKAVEQENGASCRRDVAGQLSLTSRCTVLLIIVGLLTGFLSGLFGIGGGFVIVPALVLFTKMPIHRAVGTSLLVIVLIGASGVVAQFQAGSGVSLALIAWFAGGGLIGMQIGFKSATKISGERLQRGFSMGIIVVAIWIVSKTLLP
jgi:uncharacterized membrane protein YfcA